MSPMKLKEVLLHLNKPTPLDRHQAHTKCPMCRERLQNKLEKVHADLELWGIEWYVDKLDGK